MAVDGGAHALDLVVERIDALFDRGELAEDLGEDACVEGHRVHVDRHAPDVGERRDELARDCDRDADDRRQGRCGAPDGRQRRGGGRAGLLAGHGRRHYWEARRSYADRGRSVPKDTLLANSNISGFR
jgi:hypothetical protein